MSVMHACGIISSRFSPSALRAGFSSRTNPRLPSLLRFTNLPDYFTELGRDGWELVSMTAVSSTDRVVVVFKRLVHE